MEILAGVIATMGITGIDNSSAQSMSATTTTPPPAPATNDTSQTPGKANLTGTNKSHRDNLCRPEEIIFNSISRPAMVLKW